MYCTYINTYILHAYIRSYKHIICLYVHTHICTDYNVHTYIHTYIHIFILSYSHTLIHAFNHALMQGVSRSVYRGLLDLLKYFITYIDEELQKEPEASIFSAFLVLRLAFSVFLLPKGTSSSAATKAKTPPGKSRPPENSPSFLPSISMEIAPAALTPGKTFAVSNSPNRSGNF